MEAFVNELSLHGQYLGVETFEKAMRGFNSLLKAIYDLPLDKNIFLENSIYYREAISSTLFSTSLERIKDKSVRTQFTILKDKLRCEGWSAERKHGPGPFLCSKDDVTDSSIAEAAERYPSDSKGLILNFFGFKNSNNPLSVYCTGTRRSFSVSSICDQAGLMAYFKLFPEFGVVTYDDQSKQAPSDCQTVLSRKREFKKTGLLNQRRSVYRQLRTGWLWCVDGLHFGQAAHLEVFDCGGNHISEAALDGTFRVNSQKTHRLNI